MTGSQSDQIQLFVRFDFDNTALVPPFNTMHKYRFKVMTNHRIHTLQFEVITKKYTFLLRSDSWIDNLT